MLRVRQLNSKGGLQVKITLFDTNTCDLSVSCRYVFNMTRPNWREMDLQISVKDYVPLYTHYVHYIGHKRHHLNVTHIWSKQAMHLLTSFIFNFLHNFHPNYLYQLLDKALIVIICIVYSILSMTLRHYWFNVWFPKLDAYFKMHFWDRRH